MANEIRTKFDASAAMTITLASLANDSSRQSDKITNTNKRQGTLINVKVTTGTGPTAGRLIEVYLLRSDATIPEDNFGASDAAITIDQGRLIGSIRVDATSDKTYRAVFDSGSIGPLGAEWCVALKNKTGVALNATPGNHEVRHNDYLPEAQ